MKRATLALVAAFAAIVATAETSRTATENWTRNRIGEATNATLQAAKEYADAHGGDVQSVNGKTGTVVLAAADVHALPDTYTPPAETDPTVPAWAKAENPPEGMTDNAAVLTNGALKTKSGTAITAGHVGAATPQQVTAAIAAANDYTDRSISSTNETFAAAVRATEIETEEEGSAAEYGTVGSAILALIAAVAALRKAAWSDAETNAMAQMFRADEELAGCETVQDVALAKLSQLLGEQIATN